MSLLKQTALLFIFLTLLLLTISLVSIKLYIPAINDLQSNYLIYKLLLSCALVSAITAFTFQFALKRQLKKLTLNINENLNNLADSLKSPTLNQNTNFDTGVTKIDAAIEQLKNQITQRLEQINSQAEQVKSEALIDELTGLPNRNRFIDYFEQHQTNPLQSEQHFNTGCLAVVRCSQLQEINQTRGYRSGDKYVCDIVKILKHCAGSYNNPRIFRLNGSDFAVVLPSIPLNEAETFGATLQAKLTQYQRSAELDSVAYTGLISYNASKPLGELLALTDTAISIAQTKQANSWHSQDQAEILDSASVSYGNQSWRQVIEMVIEQQNISLLCQPIIPSNQNNKHMVEVLTRFNNQQGQTLPTTAFFAMAEKLDLICELEQTIIEVILTRMKSTKEQLVQELAKAQTQYIAINLTTHSAHDAQFNTWLERRLQKDPDIASRLCFEVSEYGLVQNIKDSKRFIEMAHRVGAKVTVERFGIGLTSFKFFRELKPDHIKMDSSYTKDLDKDNNNQYFLRQIIDLAHRIGVQVFAETIETGEEKHTLEKLFIDGLQGYFLAKPEKL